ncbi:MAG TPA: gamma-glutamyl-gamma-aminobutyrate hydrolase family protein, partial [Agriterribacter sp.]|nr:gamma-glutamyl-gamma-aminobutyrate hydrolase family protein [Agriterribacter sp.]
MNIHFVQHEIFEAPGAYLKWAENRKHNISFSKVYERDPLPASVENIDLLIVMGGPQSPDTTTAACPHFDARAEIEFIKKCLDKDKAVVGVCLGSQLIGEAMGARYDRSPEKEIGNFPVQLTGEGTKDENIHP